MNFFRRRRILKETNALDLIPVTRCEHKEEEDGRITILVPKFKNQKLSKFMLGKRNPFIFIHLDETGTFTWSQIDGIKTVGQISQALRDHFGSGLAQAEERVNKFMSRLYQERYITFKQLVENHLPGKV